MGFFLTYMRKNDFNELKKKINSEYNLEKFVYKDVHSKSTAICSLHGEFETSIARLRKGHKCRKCTFERKIVNNDEFIQKCQKLWNNTYSYEKTIWTSSRCEVIITCPKHGDFTQFASNHLKGYGCAKCSMQTRMNKFLEKANQIHNSRYDYSNSSYVNNKVEIEIICPKHGNFLQRPDNHLQGNGCPNCSLSKGESKIIEILEIYKIKYTTQKVFENCKAKYKLRFDIWLPEYNTCIEYDGEQHYKPIKFFGGKKSLKKNKQYDNIKNLFCINNNINLIRISYKQEQNIEHYILDNLKKLET